MAGGRTLGSVSSANPNATTGTKPYDNFVHFLDMTEHLYYIQRPFHVELEFRRGCGDCIGVAAAVVFNPLNCFRRTYILVFSDIFMHIENQERG